MEIFTFGKIGAEDLELGHGIFSADLPDGATVNLTKIGLHTFASLANALPVHANNAAAILAGLSAGNLYRTRSHSHCPLRTHAS
jgi:hypothetical protein